jgi:hypothetical protein
VVTVAQSHGRREQTPHAFVVDGLELRLWLRGRALSPEAFVRELVEPWLLGLPLGGR